MPGTNDGKKRNRLSDNSHNRLGDNLHMPIKETDKDKDLLPCPYCGKRAEYWDGEDNSHADAIFCSNCPVGVEFDGMSYKDLRRVWNGMPRRIETHDI